MATYAELMAREPGEEEKQNSDGVLKSIGDVISSASKYINPISVMASASEPGTFVNRAVSDVKDTVSNYVTGAIQGAQELTREGNIAAETNPLALSGTPMQEGMTNAPAPEQTQEQQQATDTYQSAANTFAQETLALPAMTIGGILAPEATFAAYIGMAAKSGYDKTGTIGGAVREATYGPAIDWANQPDLSQQFYDRPVSTTISGVMDVLPLIGEGLGALKFARKLKKVGEPNPISDVAPKTENILKTDTEVKGVQDNASPIIASNANDYSYLNKSDIGESIKPNEIIKPNINVETLSDIKDPIEYNIIKESIAKDGWQGRPVLVMDNGKEGYIALTGDKRISAAKELGIDVPSVVLKAPAEDVYKSLPKDVQTSWKDLVIAKTEEERFSSIKDLREKGQIPDEAYKLVETERPSVPAKINTGEQNYTPTEIKPMESSYSDLVTKKEIVKDINELVPTRTGRINNDSALGIYKILPEVIRTQKYGDFQVAAHEIGHYIDKKLNIAGNDAELIAMADKNWGQNPIYQKFGQSIKRAEGIAEFTNEYLLNPKEAKANFPGYYDAFSRSLSENPKVQSQLDNIGNKMRKYFEQSDTAKARAGVSFANEGGKSIKESLVDLSHTVYSHMLDDLHPIQRAVGEMEKITGQDLQFEKNPYKKARMAKNSSMMRAEMLITDKDPAMVQAVLNDLYHDKIKYAETLQSILSSVDPKELDIKYPYYLKNGNFKNWEEAFSTLLVSKRSLEVRKVNFEEPLKAITANEQKAIAAVDKAKSNVTIAKETLKSNQAINHQELRDAELKAQKERNLTQKSYSESLKQAIKDAKKIEDKEALNVENISDKLSEQEDIISSSKEVSKEVVTGVRQLEAELDTAQKSYENAIKNRVKAENKGYYKNTEDIKALEKATIEEAKANSNLNKITKQRKSFEKQGYDIPMEKETAQNAIKSAPKELNDLTQKFYDYYDNLLSISEDSGLIDNATHMLLKDKYENYSKMARDFSDEGKQIYSKPLRKLKEGGSSRLVIDPLESAVRDTFATLREAETNKVKNSLIEWAKEQGTGRLIEKVPGTTGDQAKSIFTVLVDGKKQAYQTTPELYKAVTTLNRQAVNDLTRLIQPFAKALRIGATVGPDFLVRNMIKDTLTASIQSVKGFTPGVDTIKGAKSLYTNKKAVYEFKASGVPMTTFVGQDRPGVVQMLNSMKGKSGWQSTTPAQIVSSVVEGIRKVSETSEASTRLAEFMNARSKGMSIEEAGLIAKEITTDFSRAGTVGRQINQAIPFFNAALQGTDRFFRAIHDDPIRVVGQSLMYITLPSVGLWAMNHDQDWYKETNDTVKNMNWLIKAPDNIPVIGGTIIRIPKPFEPGLLFGSSIERALDQYYEQDSKGVSAWVQSVIDGLTPGLIPTVLGPILEWQANYNFFTNRPIVPDKLKLLPDEKQFTNSTSEFSKKVGEQLGLSPMKIDNTIQGYTASAGKFIVGISDYAIGDKTEAPAKTISEAPGIKSFTYDPYKNPQSVQDFYDKLNAANQLHEAEGKKGFVPRDLRELRKASEAMAKIRKQNSAVYNSEKTPEQKRTLIDQNNAKILNIAKKFK